MDVVFLLMVGAIAGTLAGLLGVGGGIIIVPLLVVFFNSQGVNIDVLMHVAIGTSLATIVVTSLSSIYAHHQHGAIDWPVFKIMSIGVFTGGLFGAFIANFISGENLKITFSIFLLFISMQMFFGGKIKAHRKLPKPRGIVLVGTIIGSISSVMGVGGGSMSVPFLTWCNINIRNAIATSSAIGFPIAVSGTLGFIVLGLAVPNRPELSIGYINLPAFISIVISSVMFAPLGAKMAHRISTVYLNRLFAVFLLMVALRMFIS